jgi:RHS repeat-associated protein
VQAFRSRESAQRQSTRLRIKDYTELANSARAHTFDDFTVTRLGAGIGGAKALAKPAARPLAACTGVPSNGLVRSYYFFNGARVAMREIKSGNCASGNGAVTWLHTDQLGSSSLATSASGTTLGQARYAPYGTAYWSPTVMGTDRRFTGHRSEVLTGLIDMQARYFDPLIGRFISADTVVPSPFDPQSLNRFSYVRNSPLNRVDPTGHDDVFAQLGGFVLGVGMGLAEANLPPPQQVAQAADSLSVQESSFATGRVVGNVLGIAQGLAEVAAGAGVDVGGGGLCLTGIGCVVGAPAVAAGTAIAVHGVAVATNATGQLAKNASLIKTGADIDNMISQKQSKLSDIKSRLDDKTLEDARDQLSGTGKTWYGTGDRIQHDKTVRDGQRSLKSLIKQINSALGNRNLTGAQRAGWQSLLDDAEAFLSHTQEYVP